MITFTELEVVLGIGIIAVLWANRNLHRELVQRAEERLRMINMMQEVADGELLIERVENGVRIVKKNPRPQASIVPTGEGSQGRP